MRLGRNTSKNQGTHEKKTGQGKKRDGKDKNHRVKLKKQTAAIAVLLAAVVVAAGVGLAVLAPWTEEAKEPVDKESEKDKEVQEKDKEEELALSPLARCEFCGVPKLKGGEKLARPVTITLGNSPQERPHSGLSQACVVYEYPVEGGFTRLIGIFSHGYEGAIGPVRSARYYFVTLAQEHDSLYAHVGGYPPVMEKIRRHNTANINEFQHGGAFWRSQDRIAPFNTYTTLDNIIQAAERSGYRGEGERGNFLPYWDPEESAMEKADADQDWDWVKEEGVFPPMLEYAEKSAEEIAINYGSVRVEYVYQGDQKDFKLGEAEYEPGEDENLDENANTLERDENQEALKNNAHAPKGYLETTAPGSYKRLVNGSPHEDVEADKSLVAQDIIVQYVSSRVIDDVGRLDLGMIGEGEGKYLVGGKMVPIKWEKESHRAPTEFYVAETGDPLEIMPGQTWVHVVPIGRAIDITSKNDGSETKNGSDIEE